MPNGAPNAVVAAIDPETQCPPCQVIIWDRRLTGMVQAFEIIMSGQWKRIHPDLLDKWIHATEKACGEMQPILDQISGYKS